MATADASGTPSAGQRLDKWLWFARVIKSRTQAAGLVTDGKVRVNRLRVDKAGASVKVGDVITVTVRGAVRVLKVTSTGVRRGPAPEARGLYEDLTPVVSPESPTGSPGFHPVSQGMSGERTAGSGRPTKRERRQLTRLTDNNEG